MKQINCIFIILLLISFNGFSKDSYVAEGEFWAAEDDSSRFIKQQLKISALKNALNQFFSQMELNSTVFWQLLDRKIATDLERRKSFLDKKIEKARDAQKFEQVIKLENKWRRRNLSYSSKYLESRRLYLSFSASGVTSSMVNPQLKMAKFKVSLNRAMVRRLYFEITKGDSNRQYKNLLISFDIEAPLGDSGHLLELNESLSMIEKAVTDKWVSWLEKEYEKIFSNFIITNDAHHRQLDKYIFSPPGSVNLIDMSMISKKEEPVQQINEDQNILDLSEKTNDVSSEINPRNDNENIITASKNEMDTFKDSQWVKIKLRISDVEYDHNFKRIGFNLSGGHIFFDLNSREISLAEDYKSQDFIFDFNNQSDFLSGLGTTVYSLPLDGFRAGRKIFSKAPQINNQAKLTIRNINKPEQIIGLADFMNLGGDSVNLRVSSFDIVDEGAKITLNYFGEIDNLRKKFFEWENKKVIPENRWHFMSEEEGLSAELLPEASDSDTSTSIEERL